MPLSFVPAPMHALPQSPFRAYPSSPACSRRPVRCAPRARLVPLSTGVKMEVIDIPSYLPLDAPTPTPETSPAPLSKPPLVFVHGSMHGAWCFHHFQAFFSRQGYQTFSISLRGAGRTVVDSKAIPTAEQQIDDLNALMEQLRLARPPVVVAHSMGGLIVQKWVEHGPVIDPVGMVLLASAPPTGRSPLSKRITKQFGFWKAIRLTMGFMRRSCVKDVGLCREMFFSSKDANGFREDVEGDDILKQYMTEMEMTQQTIDSKSATTPVQETGNLKGKVLVYGAELDNLIDKQALEETAELWDGDLQVLQNAPHNLMLYSQWEVAAKAILDWIESQTAQ